MGTLNISVVDDGEDVDCNIVVVVVIVILDVTLRKTWRKILVPE